MMKFISREFAESVRRAFMNSFGVDLPDTETLIASHTDVALCAKVILYNDEIHTFDEVAYQLMKAIGCSLEEGEQIATEVDSYGLAYVFEGDMGDCLRVSGVLEEIALHTEVTF